MKEFREWLIENGWETKELSRGRLHYQFKDKDGWRHEFLVKEEDGKILYSFISVFRNGWYPMKHTSLELLKKRCQEIMIQPSIKERMKHAEEITA